MNNFGKKIMIADDNEMNRMILTDMLEKEFDLIEANDGAEVIEILKERVDEIGIILLDINMPVKNGLDVLAEMNLQRWTDDVQVIIISAENLPVQMRRAYDLGAVDFINRPFDRSIVHRRIVNTIMLYAKQKQLTHMVAEQIAQREHTTMLMVTVLSYIVEARNGESGRHVRDINIITEALLRRLLGRTDRYGGIAGDLDVICTASSFHDIGKINIPSEILNKPGKLTAAEYEIMKTHAAIGGDMMDELTEFKNEPLVKYSRQICRWHHERWDGSGYPDGLKGDEIPIAAQVVSLADVYDALTSERCYKKAYSHEKAMEMIMNGECGAFNPLLLECLRDSEEQLRKELTADAGLESVFDGRAEESIRKELENLPE